MSAKPRITLEEVVKEIGDEAGRAYTWFLIAIDAQGVIDEHVTIKDIRETIRSENLGYYKASWGFIKNISKSLSAVVVFDLVGCKSEETFLTERAKLNQKARDWTGLVCDFEFYIYDGEIWEINGKDTVLTERLKKTFSPLPIMLM